MKAYLAFENDYDHGDELIGVFDTLEQAQSFSHAYRVEMWEGPVLKQPWERERGEWKIISW